MYKVIIELKKDISDETLKELTEIINKAFDNRVGKVVGTETNSPYCFEFSGETEAEYGCMHWGLMLLKDNVTFRQWVAVCRWEEDDLQECCDVLAIFAKPIR